MLVQKISLSKTMKILLISLGVIVVLGGGYFAYTKFFSGTSQTPVTTTEAVTVRPSVPTFDDAIFSDPRFYQLTKQPYSGFANQYEGISLSATEPLPPSDIRVENPARGRTLIISWELPQYVNFTKIRIYRSEDGVAASQIATIDVDQSVAHTRQTYQDSNLTDNKTYYYLVRSVTADNLESKNSLSVKNIPTDIYPPDAPTNIRVESQPDGTVMVSWVNPTDEDFASIVVYRSTQRGAVGSAVYSGAKGEPVSGSEDRRMFIDTNIAPNTAYYYLLTSVDGDGNESSIDVLATPFRATDYNPFEPVNFQ